MLFRRLLAGVLGLWVLHFVAVGVFLSTPLFEWALGLDPRDTTVEIDRGWSFVPGYVHLRRARVHVQDSQIDLTIELPRVETSIRLADLFRRRVLLSDLHARGMSAKLVRRPRAPTPSSDPPDPWQLKFVNLKLSDIRVLQLDQFAYRGRAEIRGGFALTPGRRIEVLPTRLELRDGHVSDVFPELAGWLDLRIWPFDLSEGSDEPVFGSLDVESELKGRVSHLGWLKAALDSAPGLELAEKPGPFDSRVKIERGVILPGSRLRLESPEWRIRLRPVTFVGKTRLDWSVPRTAYSVMNLTLSDYRVKPAPEISGPLLRIRIESRDLGLGNLFETLRFKIESRERPARIALKEKGVSGRGQITYRALGRIEPKGTSQVVRGSLDVKMSDVRFDFEKTVEPPLKPGWWARFRLDNVEIRPDAEQKNLGTGRLSLRLRDTLPVVAYLKQEENLSSFVGSLMASDSVSFGAAMRWRRGALVFRDSKLDLGTGRDVTGSFKMSQDWDGAWIARVWPAWVGIAVKDSKVEHKILPGKKWLEAELREVGVE